jgi:hypothetical protein
MAFIVSALKGGAGMGAVATAAGFGLGWLFWSMFLLSNTLDRMQKILTTPTPAKPMWQSK